jgi:hypothetical protein
LRRAARQRVLIPSFLVIDVLVNLITVSQMDPYDPDSSDGGSEFPSQSTVPEPTTPIMRRISTASSPWPLITLLINVTVQRSRRSGNTAESAVGSAMVQWIDIGGVATKQKQ